MKILVTMPDGLVRDSFFNSTSIKKLESLGEVVWNESGTQLTPDQLKYMLAGVDIAITGWGSTKFCSNVLEGADNLKLIAHTGGTVACITADETYDRGLKVISGNRIFAESLAEGTLTYILCALRNIPYYANEVHKEQWPDIDSAYEGLLEQPVGLVGFGMTAKFLVRMLEPFRVTIKVYDPHVSDDVLRQYHVMRASLDEIFHMSKVVSVHAPRTPETFHMISRRHLRLLPDGALLVNTARGSIIDEKALADELQSQRFRAILDVFEEEPLPKNSRLRGLSNVILLPHIGGPTYDRRSKVTMALISDMENFLEGRPLQLEIPKEYAKMMTR